MPVNHSWKETMWSHLSRCIILIGAVQRIDLIGLIGSRKRESGERHVFPICWVKAVSLHSKWQKANYPGTAMYTNNKCRDPRQKQLTVVSSFRCIKATSTSKCCERKYSSQYRKVICHCLACQGSPFICGWITMCHSLRWCVECTRIHEWRHCAKQLLKVLFHAWLHRATKVSFIPCDIYFPSSGSYSRTLTAILTECFSNQ